MADRGDTHYRVGTLNRWFAGSSLFLLAATLWMVLDDWSRSWKGYQREFKAIEVARAEAQLASPEAKAVLAEEERLRDERARAEQALEDRRNEIRDAEQELRDLKNSAF